MEGAFCSTQLRNVKLEHRAKYNSKGILDKILKKVRLETSVEKLGHYLDVHKFDATPWILNHSFAEHQLTCTLQL